MNYRDKVAALWLNLEMTLNALDELGEYVRVSDTGDGYSVLGKSGKVRWDRGTPKWKVMEL